MMCGMADDVVGGALFAGLYNILAGRSYAQGWLLCWHLLQCGHDLTQINDRLACKPHDALAASALIQRKYHDIRSYLL